MLQASAERWFLQACFDPLDNLAGCVIRLPGLLRTLGHRLESPQGHMGLPELRGIAKRLRACQGLAEPLGRLVPLVTGESDLSPEPPSPDYIFPRVGARGDFQALGG